MKTLILVFKVIVFIIPLIASSSMVAQGTINSLHIIPPNPTMTDTIRIIADVTVNSAPCTLLNTSCYPNGNLVNIDAFHCYGMLPVLCDASDTCKVNPLAPGTYSLAFHLWTGYPCPNPTMYQSSDTAYLPFVVTTITGIVENQQKQRVCIYPNPNKGLFFVTNNKDNGELMLFSVDGRLLEKYSLMSGKSEISTQLEQGLYVAVFFDNNSCNKVIPVCIIH